MQINAEEAEIIKLDHRTIRVIKADQVRNVVALALTQLGKGGASGVLIDSMPACMPMLVTIYFA
jgi:hypothetical protein